MPDPHWENLKELFHAALALSAHERAAYLDRASGGDAALRQAVVSLLKSHEQTDNFVDSPAYQAAAEMVIDGAEFKGGQSVADYQIISSLGEGGMGKVYLAEDTRLHRPVALKFLSRTLTQDHDRLRRFQQEARAASALNHPNILTIHGIGESDGHRFIATEFIEGETLRERLGAGVDLTDALEIAIQIASALVAAHRVGVVHRDIKPENIMIRRDDGLVKVLDFGLAKTSRIVAGKSIDNAAPTQFKTGPGVVIGTIAYMSPEQARGEAVDARTDIWSLGVILYEMVTGASPFIASTSNEIISAILARTPPPRMARNAGNVPDRLEEIVQKALAKNKGERYQTSQDFLIDLKRFKESLQIEANIGRGKFADNATPFSADVAKPTQPAGPTKGSISSAEYIANQVKAHKGGAIMIVALVLLTIAAGIAVYEWRVKHTSVAATAAPQVKSLAVLPLKSLDSGENYLGVGIADAVIRKISQTGQLTVRPTSAVLKYVKDDADSLTAAHQLNADAVLEGTWQRSGDRLRVTVNLLRTSDGASLYVDNFDLTTADVFAIQDKVAQQVAARLRISFDTGQRTRNEQYPTDPRAYEAYIRGVTSLDERGYEGSMPQMQTTINFLTRSIEIDPKYALSHAKLGFAYAWTAVAIEPGNSRWADLAKEQIKLAQELDPNLVETHFAHAYLLWTGYEGYQNEAAIRELLLAKQLDPNSSSPALPAILGHVGLDDLASRELQRALDIDPTSQSLRDLKIILPYLRGDPDAWFVERKQIPSGFARVDPWYYLRKGLLADAQKAIDERLPKTPQNYDLLMQQALLLALRGDSRAAESRVSEILSKIQPNDQSRHHSTYDAACIYALTGNSSEAVKWLKETAATGFPNYPLFARDHFLDRIRQSPEFVQFMAEQKAQWDTFLQDFGG
jgi:serine/threonine protein kinase/TolB-like protein